VEPLTQTITLAHPKGLIWKQLEATGSWAIQFPANHGIVFNYAVSGSCICKIEEQVYQLNEGDFLMLVRPPAWVLGSDEGSPTIDYPADRPTAARLGDGDGPLTASVGGRFVLDEINASLLTELLPPLTVLRGAEASAGRVGQLLSLLGDEAKSARPGQSIVLERLLELLLIEVIRNPSASAREPETGLLRGLTHPQVAKAIQAMHSDVAHRWTVAELATHVGMSRSGFAAHFAATVGIPPIDYLLRWRIALAKDALRNGRMRLADVAEMIGYESVSAFSVAFTRTVGCPPSIFAAGTSTLELVAVRRASSEDLT
jgi:AraC-like DNA-binding protein